MLKVGLTGGIGSGKSTVANIFEQLGAAIIDTDVISRQLTAESAVVEQIRRRFGDSVIHPDGTLDRRMLASKVFADNSSKQALEQMLHPPIRQRVLQQLGELKNTSYAIIVVPLLLETDFHELVDRILVVDCSEDEQVRRVAARDQRSEAEIRNIIRQQTTREQRLAVADDVLLNDSTPASLRQAVEALHRRYQAM